MHTIGVVGLVLLVGAAAWLLAQRGAPSVWPMVLGVGAMVLAATGVALLAAQGSEFDAGSGPVAVGMLATAGAGLLLVQALVARRRWAASTARLERWNERLGALLSGGSTWAAWLGTDARLRFVSDGLAKQLGRAPADCAGLSAASLFGASDAARMRRSAEVPKAGAPWRTELCAPGSQERVPVEVSAVLGPDQAQGAAGWGVLLRDLRAALRLQAEEERRRRLDALLAAISAVLLRAESRDLGPAIESALGLLGAFAEADRVSTRVLDEHDPQVVRRSHLWVAAGIDRSLVPDQLSVADAPALLLRLRKGEVVRIEDARAPTPARTTWCGYPWERASAPQ